MSKVRIIPRLDIKGPNLVKGIHLEGLRVLGDPSQFALEYYFSGADEIFYMDAVASLYERNSLSSIVEKISQEVFVPMTVGGGIRTEKDISVALKSGADKICLNTAAVKNPSIISQAAQKFGSSTIVVGIEAIHIKNGLYQAFIDSGREETGLDVVEWAKEVERLGAGEIVLTSVDKEGTGEGMDVALIQKVKNAVKIPVIAHGGVSSIDNVCDVILETGVDGIAIASSLHYALIEANESLRNFTSSTEGNTSFLNGGKKFSKVKGFSLQELKNRMVQRGIPCRMQDR